MATSKDVDAMTQTIGQMSEAQSNSYEAVAENFEAFQRRNMDFAQGGLELGYALTAHKAEGLTVSRQWERPDGSRYHAGDRVRLVGASDLELLVQ